LTGFPDIAIVGGGIVGCAAAAFLAEAGARVELFESGQLAGAASGRNSGAIQHPFDPVMGELHSETLDQYRELDGFDLPAEPAGVLVLARERATVAAAGEGTLLAPDELSRLEPALAPGLWGRRLDTGYPVKPAAATLAFARRARTAGALLHEGRRAWPWVLGGGVRGVLFANMGGARFEGQPFKWLSSGPELYSPVIGFAGSWCARCPRSSSRASSTGSPKKTRNTIRNE